MITFDQLKKKVTSILESVDEHTVFSDEVFIHVDSEINNAITEFQEKLMEKLDELKEDL